MKIALGSVGASATTDLLTVLVTEDQLDKDALVNELDEALGGALRIAISDEDFTGKKDSVLVLSTARKITPKKVQLVGLGASSKVGEIELRAAAARAGRWANAEKAASLSIALRNKDDHAQLRTAAEGVILGAYRFTRYLTGERRPKKELERVHLGFHGTKESAKASAEQKKAIARGEAVALAVTAARDFVNDPPNELTPARLAESAQKLAAEHGLDAKILDFAGIRKAGMKLLEAVGRGSRNEPRLIHLSYKPEKARKSRKRVVFVGKGLTFDSGGLCIKPAQGMGDMKSDMAGAAITVALMAAVARLAPDVEVHAIAAAAENMPDGDAYRPGDVFGSLDGKTVEIINTDAEGRLVLADALAYARKLEPDYLIDHATLTGACLIALGTQTAGFYANDDKLAELYLDAARGAGESLWRMPLLDELRDSLKSDVADMKHTGDRYGGSITAALFLREFVGDAKWAHLDIAGPAYLDRPSALSPKGGTGFGLLTMVRFLEALEG
ncbi:MAG: leucyl aminopeptidase [Myxococcales bacterium]|nr:leucyl aminopeptidase [Myxococcales bacterium]